MKAQSKVILESDLSCPHCGFTESLQMPENSCQFFHQCSSCDVVLKPKSGDCCVFCSYGTVKCPQLQCC